MKIIADTNVLLRASLHDDPQQGPQADEILKEATVVVVCTVSLCEFVLGARQALYI